MASIKLRDYLVSLTSKSNAADLDLLPLLDSTDGNSLATIKRGTLTDLDTIAGWTEFSSSIEGDLFALSFASSSNVSSSLQQQIDINNLGVYTSSLKQAISVSGADVQIIGELRAKKFAVDYITSSVSLLTGSNEFGDQASDIHTFIGTINLNGLAIGTSELMAQTASQATVNTGLSAVTGAFATELGQLQTQNTSQGSVNSGISAVTGAFANELSGIQSNITSFNSVFSGVSAVTGAFSTELGTIQNDITSIENNITSFNSVFSGVSAVTGAFATELGGIQTTLTGHRGELSGIEAWTASLDDTFATDAQVADAVAALNTQTGSQNSINSGISAVSGAFATELGQLQNNVTDFTNVLSGVAAVSGAIVTELGGIQSNITSFNNVFSGVSAVTGAFATELGGIQNNISSFNNVFSGVSAVTGAFSTELGGIQTTLGGHRNELNGLESYTSSLKGAIEVSGQNVNVLGMLTAQQFNVTYVSSSVMYQSGSTEFGDTADDVHTFTGTINLNGLALGTSELMAQTASQDNVNTGLSAVTGAFATELGEIQTQLTNRRGELNGLEAYTASLKSVGLVSSSAQIATEISGSAFTSASSEFAELTLTKNGTSVQLDLSPNRVLETVKNKDPQTLPKGTPVYVSGSTGNAAHIYAASASRADRMPAAYVLDQELAFDEEGNGIVVGFINGVNTSAFNEGDNVYVGESGGYTNVKPTGNSNRIQKLGNVIAVHPTNGSGVITGAGRSNDVPNIQEGYMWVGNSSDVATQFTTSSVLGYGHDATFNDITASRLQLQDGIEVTGSIDVSGSINVTSHGADGLILDEDGSNATLSSRLFFMNNQTTGWAIHKAANHLEFKSGSIPGSSSGVAKLKIYAGTDNVEVTDGNLVIGTAGKGIDFSATSDAGGMTSELLDDYEEGTWTMGIAFGGASTGVTYSTNTGTYTKIGRQVTLNGYIQLSNKGSSTGNATITGLPFGIPNSLSSYSVTSLFLDKVTFANQYAGVGAINTTTINLQECTEAGGVSSLTEGDFANNSEIILSFTYFV